MDLRSIFPIVRRLSSTALTFSRQACHLRARDWYQCCVDAGRWMSPTSSTTPCHRTTACQTRLLALSALKTGTRLLNG